MVYQDNVSSFEDLQSTTAFMNNIFTKLLYCSEQIFVTHNVCTVHNGTETLSHLGPKIWLINPSDIKDLHL